MFWIPVIAAAWLGAKAIAALKDDAEDQDRPERV